MSGMYVIHHRDTDGFCAAYVAWKYWEICAQGGEFRGRSIQYGEEDKLDLDGMKGLEVYVLDFSLSSEVCSKIQGVAKSFVIMDHHQVTADRTEDYIIFDRGESGATLAYGYFADKCEQLKSEALETLCQYVRDRDLWLWEMPHSREVNAVIESYGQTFEEWKELECLIEGVIDDSLGVSSIVVAGRAVLRSQAKMIDRMMSKVYTVDINGHAIKIVNSPVLQSDIAERLLEDRGVAMVIVWHDAGDGKYVYSLRSDPSWSALNVTQVAMSQGGGGHPSGSAAGFVASVPPRENEHLWRDLGLGFLGSDFEDHVY